MTSNTCYITKLKKQKAKWCQSKVFFFFCLRVQIVLGAATFTKAVFENLWKSLQKRAMVLDWVHFGFRRLWQPAGLQKKKFIVLVVYHFMLNPCWDARQCYNMKSWKNKSKHHQVSIRVEKGLNLASEQDWVSGRLSSLWEHCECP